MHGKYCCRKNCHGMTTTGLRIYHLVNVSWYNSPFTEFVNHIKHFFFSWNITSEKKIEQSFNKRHV